MQWKQLPPQPVILAPIALTTPPTHQPTQLPSPLLSRWRNAGGQSLGMRIRIQVGVAVEASAGERTVAALPTTPEEQEKSHLLATLPAGHAHPVHPQNLAPGKGESLGTLPRSGLSPRAFSLQLLLPCFSLLLLSGRQPQPAAGTQTSPARDSRAQELESRRSPWERRRGPAPTMRPSFRGAPRPAAAPPLRGPGRRGFSFSSRPSRSAPSRLPSPPLPPAG